MDFFAAQDDARRNTWRLAALFAAAVVCLVVLTNLLIAVVYGWASNHVEPGRFDPVSLIGNLPAGYWLAITAAVVAVIALASGFKYLQVRQGGRSIAEALGGRLLPPSSKEFRERRLLNVVEEMAIASGIPVPPVYVIEEPSINAFAAGFGPDDAVIGVNRGTLEHLDRDELQGVIGHEFSHILNGDSRINLRLIALLHGILFIGLVGRGMLHGVGRGRHRRGQSNGGAPLLVLALGLLVIGYAGIFFGNMIKAAVSRQREFLADAAAVQFTRNPGGIAGALKKIGGLASGSAIPTMAAREASHLFFGPAHKFFLASLLSTHPPLERRIRAVDPRWDGKYPVVLETVAAGGDDQAATAADALAQASGFAGATAASGKTAEGGAATGAALEILASPEQVVERIGRLDQAALDQAARLVDGISEPLREAAHDPFSGRALVYGLVIDAAHADRQIDYLRERAEAGVADELVLLLPLLKPLDEQRRLTLIEMTVPALKELSADQYRRFSDNLIALIKSDRRIELMEWVLHALLVKELRPHFEPSRRRATRYHRIEEVADEVRALLSSLAQQGDREPASAAAAFAAGMDALGLDGSLDATPDENFQRLSRALGSLRTLAPLKKPMLLKACAATVLADGNVSARQGALLHGVAAALDCPLPPSIYQR